jgi:hypothetical protein
MVVAGKGLGNLLSPSLGEVDAGKASHDPPLPILADAHNLPFGQSASPVSA